ncbi:efflux RND transporter permease subunit [Stratiformator vulcanicus]|uniref:Efflux pump membrane transporter BepE n=1 Tax=Stratiformator vulcanicus TaxID=2527980 RepID=A0A517R654_9PLAN|nr:multidrug efflux RND transporter permease subunit [Stratiformator vulcanicus]QDT39351.1 Efflux pump membrane transporter BepE [Stratiformator vulcanicus]
MFSHFFIDRPIFATVLSIVIVIAGAVSYFALPIAQYPEIAPPVINISTTYPGANASVVATTVATPIETEVNGVPGMLYMQSRSSNDGQMSLDVTFEVGTDLDMAQVLVQNRVAIAEAKLPEEVKRQGVKTEKKSPNMLLIVNFVSPDGSRDVIELSNFATINVKDVIARVEGVGSVSLLGARDYAMRIWLDPNLMAARSMTAGDVIDALREQNVQVAAGRIGAQPAPSGVDFELTLNTLGRLVDAEQFGNVVVKTGEDGQISRLSDVARIELGAQNYDVDMSLNGAPSVGLAVYQQPGGNAIETAQMVKEAMRELRSSGQWKPDLEYEIAYDTTPFIEQSISDVQISLLQATGLVFLVVLVFLQTWRATVIPMIAVPVALIGTFAVMTGLGFSLNNLSLFGLVLAIGVVTDDAVVVVENVERNLALGLSPRDATRKAMSELFAAIIATSLVLIVVFVPTAFIAGLSGQFYKQFALTIAAATAISTFNALTLTPAWAAMLLKPKDAKRDPLEITMDWTVGWFFKGFNRFFDWASRLFGVSVAWMIRLTVISLVLYVGLLGLAGLGFRTVPGGFIPEQDKGYVVVNIQLPDGASLERTKEVSDRAAAAVAETPGVESVVAVPGFSLLANSNLSNTGAIFGVLEPFAERRGDPSRSANAVMAKLRQQFAQIQEGIVVVFGAPPVDGLGNTGGFKLQVRDRAGAGYAALQGATQALAAEANAQPGLVGLFSTFSANQPQLFIDVDREKAKAAGVPLSTVFGTLQAYLGSAYVNDFTRFGRNWQVTVQADAKYRLRSDDIGRLEVRNLNGDMVPMRTLISVRETTGPAIVNRYLLYPSADLSGNTVPGVSSGQAIAIMDELAASTLPPSMDYKWTELSLQQILAGNTAIFVFAMGTVFVFLVLAAQYESWALPISIMLIVPVCLTAAISGVWLMGQDNNIFTQIGLVVLIALSAKNAILVVEFAKEEQTKGKSRFDAAVEASKLRLRPILMTAFSFILGVIPLLTATGAGAEMRYALGLAVFSGMLGVTVFGLFLTPVFYVLVMWFVETFFGSQTGEPSPAQDGSAST